MSHRVLVLTNDFPPNGVTSSRRPGEMVKYLPQFGWAPTVVTQRWAVDNCNYDPTIVPNIQSDLVRYEFDARALGVTSKIIEQAVRFLMPQRHPYHLLTFSRIALKLAIDEIKPSVIWATVPPFNLLEVASSASRESGVPWIADFRDAWQFIPNCFVRATMKMRIDYERVNVSGAAAITTVSGGLADTLRQRHEVPIHIIPHGIDPELLSGQGGGASSRFDIVYTGGVVLGSPNFRPLLDAIGGLIGLGEFDQDDIRVHFFGAGNRESLDRMFKDHPFAHLVVDHGAVRRAEALEAQRSAAVLLAAGHPGARGVITSKLIEYLAAGVPILSIPRDNGCIDAILESTGAGVSCTTAEEIRVTVSSLYRSWRSGDLKNKLTIERVLAYSSRERARDLAAVFSRVNGDGGR